MIIFENISAQLSNNFSLLFLFLHIFWLGRGATQHPRAPGQSGADPHFLRERCPPRRRGCRTRQGPLNFGQVVSPAGEPRVAGQVWRKMPRGRGRPVTMSCLGVKGGPVDGSTAESAAHRKDGLWWAHGQGDPTTQVTKICFVPCYCIFLGSYLTWHDVWALVIAHPATVSPWAITFLNILSVYFLININRDDNAREMEALKVTSRDILDRENRYIILHFLFIHMLLFLRLLLI